MWLSGKFNGKRVSIDISGTRWNLLAESIRNLKPGKRDLTENLQVGAQCADIGCSLSIGRAEGVFSGTVEKTQIFGPIYYYKIAGTINNLKDNDYNFEINSMASWGNIPAQIGGLFNWILSEGAQVPGDYTMIFSGSGKINMEGFIWQ